VEQKSYKKIVNQRMSSRIITSEKQEGNLGCTVPLGMIRIGQNDSFRERFDDSSGMYAFFLSVLDD
jgi:hypothetical protein